MAKGERRKVQGCSKRWAPGCVKLGEQVAFCLPFAGSRTHLFHLIFIQKPILENKVFLGVQWYVFRPIESSIFNGACVGFALEDVMIWTELKTQRFGGVLGMSVQNILGGFMEILILVKSRRKSPRPPWYLTSHQFGLTAVWREHEKLISATLEM